MGLDISIRVLGIKELRKAIKQVGDKDLARALQRANKTAAERVVKTALPAVPVKTGALFAAVRATASQTAGRAVAGNARVPYAAAIHWGTGPRVGEKGPHNIKRRPFLSDAATQNISEIADDYAAEINRIMDVIREAQ
jgi:HK97 gp10 family phage protein